MPVRRGKTSCNHVVIPWLHAPKSSLHSRAARSKPCRPCTIAEQVRTAALRQRHVHPPRPGTWPAGPPREDQRSCAVEFSLQDGQVLPQLIQAILVDAGEFLNGLP